jgi:neutral ceramidase
MRHSIALELTFALAMLAGTCRMAAAAEQAAGAAVPVGAAVVDVTPDYPIRLMGYGNRQTESEGIASRLKVRALAIGGDDGDGPTILVAVDNCAVGAKITEEVAARLKAKVGLKRERFVVCATHTHCAPALNSELAYIFGKPLPADQTERIARYTRELTDAIEKVALESLADRKPATLAWGQGRVGFAANRRVLKKGRWVGFGVNPNGPTDPSLPVLTAVDPSGKVRAVLFGYACHCTTLGGEFNKICAEWAGYACDEVERQSPGAVAVAIIGCGADANPEPRRNLDDAKNHGSAAASEVNRLIAAKSGLTPLPGRIACKVRRLELPLEPVPDRAALTERARRTGSEAMLARAVLERLDRGEPIPTSVPYIVQTWTFGDDMAMVFLAGEVVVDYALRLKWETDAQRLWVVAYSNDVPCYIPSRRVLSEGGYEADSSLIFYGHASRFAPEVEDLIVKAVHELLPASFEGPRR